MAAPVPQPNTTTPPTLTAAQARALLQTLLSTNQNPNAAPAPTPTTARPISAHPKATQISPRPQQPQAQQTITIDASTRIMGHCNTIQLASPSPQEQATKIEHLVRGVLASTEKGHASVNITVQAGFNLMGSKNVVTFGSPAKGAAQATEATKAQLVYKEMTAPNNDSKMTAAAGRKRRAESEPVDVQKLTAKKVKVEGV
ncbi:hypothetical protein OEA41_005274 [Lepraria neglecta]|uniref:Uncharacterized protein n=1 Tax=Lepraria neglecta TaxID=209136 RepID=A0AAD9YZK6_9LECA|nr:hypothetical protein OEA41_005274 [Lepraria neglecta]